MFWVILVNLNHVACHEYLEQHKIAKALMSWLLMLLSLLSLERTIFFTVSRGKMSETSARASDKKLEAHNKLVCLPSPLVIEISSWFAYKRVC